MTSVTDWTEVKDAVYDVGETYRTMIATRRDEHSASRKVSHAEAEFARAHGRRVATLEAAYDEDLDERLADGKMSLGSVLRRYYEETVTPADKMKRKVK